MRAATSESESGSGCASSAVQRVSQHGNLLAYSTRRLVESGVAALELRTQMPRKERAMWHKESQRMWHGMKRVQAQAAVRTREGVDRDGAAFSRIQIACNKEEVNASGFEHGKGGGVREGGGEGEAT
jgi:hypothetical protein